MALTTVPSYQFDGATPSTWTQAITSNIPQLMDGIVELGKYAKPTLDILWQKKQYVTVNVDGTFHFDVSYGAHDVYYGDTGLTNFAGDNTFSSGAVHQDNTDVTASTADHVLSRQHLTRLTVKPTVMYSKMWITDFDRKVHQYGLHDLVEDKTFRLNHGLTEALNYEVWAKQGNDDASATTQIDGYYGTGFSDTTLTLPKSTNSYAAVPERRLYSLPALIRPSTVNQSAATNNHTLHGLSSVHVPWQSHVYIAAGTSGVMGVAAQTTPLSIPASSILGINGMNADGDNKATDDAEANVVSATWVSSVASADADCNVLLRDAPIDTTTAAAQPQTPTLSDIDFMLEKMQVGNNLEIMVACSPAAYNYIARDFFGNTLGSSLNGAATGVRTMGGPLNDYGIHFSGGFRHSGYDAIFYADPSMANEWPNSLWFWDLDALVWACVEDFGPKIYPWQRVPNSTVDAMAKVMWCQRVNRNPQATGVLLNCKFR